MEVLADYKQIRFSVKERNKLFRALNDSREIAKSCQHQTSIDISNFIKGFDQIISICDEALMNVE